MALERCAAPTTWRKNVSIEHLLIVTGLSGSGKSTAVKALEDVGYFCVDNMPTALVETFLYLADAKDELKRVALVIDSRLGVFDAEGPKLPPALSARPGAVELLFLDCDDDVLVRRFSETRRPHPLANGGSIVEGIERERALLRPLRELADVALDTTHLHVHALRRTLVDRYGAAGTGRLRITVMSFGFKHGPPVEADYVFDVRLLDNPHFRDDLRDLTGLDAPVASFLAALPDAPPLIERISGLMDFAVPRHDNEGKVSLTVAFGCTGGRHRSVYVAERIAEHLQGSGRPVQIHHRDLDRGR